MSLSIRSGIERPVPPVLAIVGVVASASAAGSVVGDAFDSSLVLSPAALQQARGLDTPYGYRLGRLEQIMLDVRRWQPSYCVCGGCCLQSDPIWLGI